MRHLSRLVCGALMGAAGLVAQPVVDSVLNPASYALPGLPNHGVAQGSLFVAFGRNLGPPGLNEVKSFPLPTAFNGISIKVTVGGTTVDCIVMNSYGAGTTPATQVVGLLPSTTPVGTGTFVLTYNNQASAPATIKVVARAFGAVAINAGGSGPAVVTDGNYQVRLITQSATSGQTLILWGTGLGPINADERQPAPFRDMTEADVKVYVGGRLAQVAFRGRSPGAAGLDQVNFVVPAGVSGCYVSLVVVVNGIPSNWVTLPVAANNGPCSDPGGLTAQDIDAARTRGNLKAGAIALSRLASTMTLPPPIGTITSTTDFAGASFERFDFLGLISSQGFGGFGTTGSCVVYQYRGEEPGDTDPVVPVGLDAGASLTVTGPKGAKQIPLVQGRKGVYSAQLGSAGLPIPGDPLYLDPGSYTVTGPGGADVGPFSTNVTLPAAFNWANQASINNVPRGQDLLVTWSGAPANGVVVIQGSSTIMTPSPAVGAMFMCLAPGSASQFSVPSYVLSALPVSQSTDGFPTGFLTLATDTEPVRFNATGLDYGVFVIASMTGKPVSYQ